MALMYNIGKMIFVTMIILLFLGLFILLIDAFTMREMGTEKAPCIDREGDPFVDELCDKTIWCSWLGIMEERTCKEVRLSKLKRKEVKK